MIHSVWYILAHISRTSKKNSYWQPEKCTIRSLRGLWNALSGMLSTCPLARTWRIQMQIKACEWMRGKAKDESIHEGIESSSRHLTGKKRISLFLSLSREDLIKFFWPRRFILKTIPLLFRSDNPFVPIKMNAPYRQHVNLNMIHGRGKL